MATCITHEPNHEIDGYQTPITGNFVCNVCGPYCNCNEDFASCGSCNAIQHYSTMVEITQFDYECQECFDKAYAAYQEEKVN
tara:strand:- start:640 stop:885 length:246 start_codon:yes stop_codon:yes gene_type:complete